MEASRKFRETLTGKDVYSYRSKVEMGMSQTRVLNEPPLVTPKDDVMFDIPDDVDLPDSDEGILMLSVLEMQGLLRSGKLTATKLTDIALAALKKYDPEYNMLEVELEDLAYSVAAEVDAMLLAGDYVSPIMGIPFAVKDTYDVKVCIRKGSIKLCFFFGVTDRSKQCDTSYLSDSQIWFVFSLSFLYRDM